MIDLEPIRQRMQAATPEDVAALIAEIERLRRQPARNIYCWRPVRGRKLHLFENNGSRMCLCGYYSRPMGKLPVWDISLAEQTYKRCLRKVQK